MLDGLYVRWPLGEGFKSDRGVPETKKDKS